MPLKREIKEITKNQYLQIWNYITTDAGTENLESLYNYILRSDKSESMKHNYLNAILSIVGHKILPIEMSDALEKKYKDAKSKYFELIHDRPPSEKVSKIVNELTIPMIEDIANKELAKKTLKGLENAILIKIHLFVPLRNDLQEMQISTTKKNTPETGNVIYVPARGDAVIAMREYKNKKDYEQTKLRILPKELKKLIQEFIKNFPERKYLFESQSGEPLSSSAFTHKFNDIFKPYGFDGVSSTMIRKIFQTNEITPEDIETIMKINKNFEWMFSSAKQIKKYVIPKQ